MTRALRPLAALALVAAIGAGCSKAPAQTGTGSSGANTNAATHEQAVKFAECMRGHGVKAFPDPDAGGELTIDAVANRSSVDPSTPAFEQAISACKDLEHRGSQATRGTPRSSRLPSGSHSASVTTA